MEERFPRLVHRSGLTTEQFITERLRRNDQPVYPNTILENGDILSYRHLADDESYQPIRVIAETNDLIIVDKPAGISVTPTTYSWFNSAVHQVRKLVQSDDIHPLHRLDIETSGVLLFGRGRTAVATYQQIWPAVDKEYVTAVHGLMDLDITEITGIIDPDIDSEIYSKLRFRPDSNGPTRTIIDQIQHHTSNSIVYCRLDSGHTNQIRVHMAGIGHPVIGDKKYSAGDTAYLNWYYRNEWSADFHLNRQILHATEVRLIDPITGSEMIFQSDPAKLLNWVQSEMNANSSA